MYVVFCFISCNIYLFSETLESPVWHVCAHIHVRIYIYFALTRNMKIIASNARGRSSFSNIHIFPYNNYAQLKSPRFAIDVIYKFNLTARGCSGRWAKILDVKLSRRPSELPSRSPRPVFVPASLRSFRTRLTSPRFFCFRDKFFVWTRNYGNREKGRTREKNRNCATITHRFLCSVYLLCAITCAKL